MKYFISLLIVCLFGAANIQAQQLPSKPDPNKCYVRSVTPDLYERYQKEYWTYSAEEAELYPHKVWEIEVNPEYGQWETVTYEGCESDNPGDCQVLCYKTYEAKSVTIYEPKNDSLGSPYWKEVEFEELIEKGGLSAYIEIDCELTSYNVLSVSFQQRTAEFSNPTYDLQTIEDRLVDLLYDRPTIQIQINAHTSTLGDAAENQEITQLRAETIKDYLVGRGINQRRIVARGYGESQLKNRCVDGADCNGDEHRLNERVEFRVLSVDY